MTTLAPASARRRAIARPRPCAPPVTTAPRPASDSRSTTGTSVTSAMATARPSACSGGRHRFDIDERDDAVRVVDIAEDEAAVQELPGHALPKYELLVPGGIGM